MSILRADSTESAQNKRGQSCLGPRIVNTVRDRVRHTLYTAAKTEPLPRRFVLLEPTTTRVAEGREGGKGVAGSTRKMPSLNLSGPDNNLTGRRAGEVAPRTNFAGIFPVITVALPVRVQHDTLCPPRDSQRARSVAPPVRTPHDRSPNHSETRHLCPFISYLFWQSA